MAQALSHLVGLRCRGYIDNMKKRKKTGYVGDKKGKYSTLGSALLFEWARENGITQADLGKILGVSRQTLTNWKHGLSRPRGWQRWLIETLTDIESEEWITEEESDFLAAGAFKVLAMMEKWKYVPENALEKIKSRVASLSAELR